MLRIYILVAVVGLVGGAVYGAYFYYKDTQARIQTLTENAAKLEIATQTQKNTYTQAGMQSGRYDNE